MSVVKNEHPLRHLEIDVERYQSFLDGADMSEVEKREFLAAIWSIIIAFVDLGFEVHPLQQVCGQDRSDALEKDDAACRDGLSSIPNGKQNERRLEPGLSAVKVQSLEGLRNEPD